MLNPCIKWIDSHHIYPTFIKCSREIEIKVEKYDYIFIYAINVTDQSSLAARGIDGSQDACAIAIIIPIPSQYCQIFLQGI